MTKRMVGGLLLTAAVACLITAPLVRADNTLCFAGKTNPQNDDAWQVICAGSDAAYAEANVTPTETGESLQIHVTDHLDCSQGTHLECGFASTVDGEFECLTENDPIDLDYEGYLPGVWMYCGCYSEGVTCQG